MKGGFHKTAFVAMIFWTSVLSQDQALFLRNDVLDRGKRQATNSNADQMVQNILQWLQGVYTQNSRKIRQGSFREYLPPNHSQKPRPFEPAAPGVYLPPPRNGYPPAGITPQPPFPPYTQQTGTPSVGYPSPGPTEGPRSSPGTEQTQYPTGQTGYPTGQTGYPSGRPTSPTRYPPAGYPTGRPTGYPTGRPTGYPTGRPTGYPTGRPTGYPTGRPTGYPTGRPTGYPTGRPTGYPTGRPTGFPSQPPSGYPTEPTPGFPSQPPTGYPSESPTGYPSPSPTAYPTQQPTGYPSRPSTGYPSQQPTEYPTQPPTGVPTRRPSTGFPTYPPVTRVPTLGPGGSQPTRPPVTGATGVPTPGYTRYPDENTVPTTDHGPGVTGSPQPTPSGDDDDKHPPHIHDINVECAKDMMTITIEFNRIFNGVIYSKGFYTNPECRYVQENTGQTKYTFTLNLNACGTEFINAFETERQSYLENVLVLQNEASIQEVWDTIRSVRCLWEGNLKESLSVALSVGMLTQEIVTFSGDTAMAKLDIQLGKGPFAPSANGLVKIGETMTLVVSVSGDAGFDIQVRDCRAKDSSGENSVALTDNSGCVLKPKLFGAFQKTRDTGDSGATIIAYAFFNAFKFPDVMDLMIECNIELCKTDCEVCPEPNQPLEPGRRRKRDIYSNETIGEPVTMGKRFRVILPEDLTDGETVVNVSELEGVCMSTQSFVFSSALLVSLLTTSSLFSAYLWLRHQRLHLK